MKSKNVIADKYNIFLAKMSIIKQGKYWQKLVNTDEKRSIIFSDDHDGSRYENNNFPFSILMINIVMSTIRQCNIWKKNIRYLRLIIKCSILI